VDHVIVQFGALLAFLLAIGELIVRPIVRRNLYLAGVFFCLAFMLLHGWAGITGYIRVCPQLLFAHVPAIFLIGPAAYRWLLCLIGRPHARFRWFEMIPILIMSALMIPVYAESSETKLQMIAAFRSGAPPILPRLALGTGSLVFAIYLIIATKAFFASFRLRDIRSDPAVQLCSAILSFAFVETLVAGANFFHPAPELIEILLVSLSVFLPITYLLSQRYPQFFMQMQSAVSRSRYEYSRLKGVDLEDLRKRLDLLMSEKQLFVDEDLTIEDLAAEMQVSVHQLSEFFNKNLSTNFAGYVNSFRVRKACELLLAEPDRTILSVAYDVGFGAKSTFNLVFIRQMGITPSAFRRKGVPSPSL